MCIQLDYHDNPSRLKEISAKMQELGAQLPDYVLSHVPEKGEMTPLNYALVLVKDGKKYFKFPVNNKANTWLSLVYAVDNYGSIPDSAKKTVFTNVFKACRHFEIDLTKVSPALLALEETIKPLGNEVTIDCTAMPKHAEYTAFAYVNGDKKKFPIGSKDQTEKSMEKFNSEYYKIPPYALRRDIACNIKIACEKFEVPTKGRCKIYSSEVFNPDFKNEMSKRAEVLRHARIDASKEIEEMIKIFESQPQVDDMLTKVADFDTKYKLDNYWDTSLADPCIVVLGTAKLPEVVVLDRKYTGEEIIKIAESPHTQEKFTVPFLKKIVEDPISSIENMSETQQALFFDRI